ncbi:hypothetical protein TWF281_010332 [Arthrobotrys megalospora]
MRSGTRGLLSTLVPIAAAFIFTFPAQICPTEANEIIPLVNEDIVYNGRPWVDRACRLGLFNGGGESWTGYPLGRDWDDNVSAQVLADAGSGWKESCQNLDYETVGPIATSGTDRYFISGYCACALFPERDCEGAPFIAGDSGPYGNGDFKGRRWNVKSMSCLRRAAREFRECSLAIVADLVLEGGGDLGFYRTFKRDDKTPIAKDGIEPLTGKGACTTVPDIFRGGLGQVKMVMTGWEIHACTCHFFTNDNCQMPSVLIDGHGGVVKREMTKDGLITRYPQSDDVKALKIDPFTIGSFRCDSPYGPSTPKSNCQAGELDIQWGCPMRED